MFIRLRSTALVFVLMTGSALFNSAFADYTYTYTGNNFDYFANLTVSNQFTSADSVTFSFTTNALYTNTNIPLSSITSWSVSDGLTNYNSLNGVSLASYTSTYFTTDATGNLISWDYTASLVGNPSTVITSNSAVAMTSVTHPTPYAGEYVQVTFSPGLAGYYAGISDHIGTWTETATASSVPVPAAVWLFATGLASFGLFARRKTV